MFWHKHKYGTVQEDGYQYCEKCGKAIAAPCAHDWERIKETNVEQWGNLVGTIYTDCCKKCLLIRDKGVYGQQYKYLYSPIGSNVE